TADRIPLPVTSLVVRTMVNSAAKAPRRLDATRRRQRAQVFRQAGAEEFVLGVAAGQWARGACHRARWGEDLARLELFQRQVEIDAVGEAVPPVVAVRGAGPADVGDEEVAAEQVVDDQRR